MILMTEIFLGDDSYDKSCDPNMNYKSFMIVMRIFFMMRNLSIKNII